MRGIREAGKFSARNDRVRMLWMMRVVRWMRGWCDRCI